MIPPHQQPLPIHNASHLTTDAVFHEDTVSCTRMGRNVLTTIVGTRDKNKRTTKKILIQIGQKKNALKVHFERGVGLTMTETEHGRVYLGDGGVGRPGREQTSLQEQEQEPVAMETLPYNPHLPFHTTRHIHTQHTHTHTYKLHFQLQPGGVHAQMVVCGITHISVGAL